MNYLANAGDYDKTKLEPAVRYLYQKELDFWGVEDRPPAGDQDWGNGTFRTDRSGSPRSRDRSFSRFGNTSPKGVHHPNAYGNFGDAAGGGGGAGGATGTFNVPSGRPVHTIGARW